MSEIIDDGFGGYVPVMKPDPDTGGELADFYVCMELSPNGICGETFIGFWDDPCPKCGSKNTKVDD